MKCSIIISIYSNVVNFIILGKWSKRVINDIRNKVWKNASWQEIFKSQVHAQRYDSGLFRDSYLSSAMYNLIFLKEIDRNGL